MQRGFTDEPPFSPLLFLWVIIRISSLPTSVLCVAPTQRQRRQLPLHVTSIITFHILQFFGLYPHFKYDSILFVISGVQQKAKCCVLPNHVVFKFADNLLCTNCTFNDLPTHVLGTSGCTWYSWMTPDTKESSFCSDNHYCWAPSTWLEEYMTGCEGADSVWHVKIRRVILKKNQAWVRFWRSWGTGGQIAHTRSYRHYLGQISHATGAPNHRSPGLLPPA